MWELLRNFDCVNALIASENMEPWFAAPFECLAYFGLWFLQPGLWWRPSYSRFQICKRISPYRLKLQALHRKNFIVFINLFLGDSAQESWIANYNNFIRLMIKSNIMINKVYWRELWEFQRVWHDAGNLPKWANSSKL